MSSKARRQARIIELIRDEAIETQEDLAARLRQDSIQITQATVSRDIKELGLVKLPNHDGHYRYALPDQRNNKQDERFLRIFRECIVSYDFSENLVVINTLPATAAGVAEAIDSLQATEVVGTLSGERTVFVAVRPREAVVRFLERLQQLSHS